MAQARGGWRAAGLGWQRTVQLALTGLPSTTSDTELALAECGAHNTNLCLPGCGVQELGRGGLGQRGPSMGLETMQSIEQALDNLEVLYCLALCFICPA